MSAIPPHSIGSVLQSDAAQHQQSRIQNTEENARSNAARQASGRVDDIIEIEAADTDDTRVDADSGGLGGQGRHDAEPGEDSTGTEPDANTTDDDNAAAHLDVQA